MCGTSASYHRGRELTAWSHFVVPSRAYAQCVHPLHSSGVVFRIASETKSPPLASLVGSFGIVSRPWWVSEGSSGTLVGPLGIPWGPLKGSLGCPWWVMGVLGGSLGCLGGAVGIPARLATHGKRTEGSRSIGCTRRRFVGSFGGSLWVLRGSLGFLAVVPWGPR